MLFLKFIGFIEGYLVLNLSFEFGCVFLISLWVMVKHQIRHKKYFFVFSAVIFFFLSSKSKVLHSCDKKFIWVAYILKNKKVFIAYNKT